MAKTNQAYKNTNNSNKHIKVQNIKIKFFKIKKYWSVNMSKKISLKKKKELCKNTKTKKKTFRKNSEKHSRIRKLDWWMAKDASLTGTHTQSTNIHVDHRWNIKPDCESRSNPSDQ